MRTKPSIVTVARYAVSNMEGGAGRAAARGASDAASTAHDLRRLVRPRLLRPPGRGSFRRRPVARPARLHDYATRNGYVVAREYIDEAESGRVVDRPQFRKMLDGVSATESPFQKILVWKFSRFKREHAVAFKSMLRRRGNRVTSITEHADDTPTGKLMDAIIESVDKVYSENLIPKVQSRQTHPWGLPASA